MSTAAPKALLVSHSMFLSGAPLVLLNVGRWLKQSGWELEIFSDYDGEMRKDFEDLGVVHLNSISGSFGVNSLWRRLMQKVRPSKSLTDLLKSRRFDIVYSNTITNGRVVKSLGIHAPVVTHVHELEYWIKRSGVENLTEVKKQTSRYIAASDAVRTNLVCNHGIDESIVDVVHAFIATTPSKSSDLRVSTCRRQFGIMPSDSVVCASGQEFWRKGRDLVPHLLCELRKQLPDRRVQLVWVGQPGTQEEEAALKFDLERLGLLDRFHLTGSTTTPELFFSMADVFVLTSRDDPFPLVCLENAGLGTPIVCFANSGGMPEFVGKNECGEVVPYLDVPAMAGAIGRLLSDEELRTRKGQAAKRNLEQHFLAESACPKILKIIERTIEESGRGASQT